MTMETTTAGTTTAAGRVVLPQWVAFAPRGRHAAAVATAKAPAEARRSAGSITVFGTPDDSQLATFDRGESSVLFEGYLFDRVRLARELNVADDESAAALAIAAYERWAEAVFDRLDGRYLLAIYDARQDRLLLGHDALGRHPVFYALADDGVWFSSNVLALGRSGAVRNDPNRVSFALNALLFWPEAGDTHFAAVHRLQPGYFLEAASASVRRTKYWEPMPPEGEPFVEEREALERFEPSLTDAVRRAVDLGPEGIMLSGGLDSVVIAALATRLRPSAAAPLVAVSARTGGPLNYEEKMQSLVADALGMPHEIRKTTDWLAGRDTLGLSLALASELPAPTDVWWVGSYTEFYRLTAATGLTTLLTGSGGDNWLGVADAYAADLIRRGDLAGLYRFYCAEVGTRARSRLGTIGRLLWHGGLRWHLDAAWARLAPKQKTAFHRRRWQERLPAWLAPDPALRSELLDRLLGRRVPSLTRDGRRPSSYYLHSLRAFENPFMHHENETAFHMESMCGLRLVSPYHDRALVSFFNRIPPAALLHGERYKGLLRPIAVKHLPAFGLESQRKEYDPALLARKHETLSRSIDAAWPDCRFETLGRLGVVDPAGVHRTLAEAPRTVETLGRMVALLMAERWAAANTSA